MGAVDPEVDRQVEPQVRVRWLLAGWLFAACAAASPSPAAAQELAVALHVIDIAQGSELTESVRNLANGGYELSDGTWVSLPKWYHTDWPDTHIDMLTQVGEDFGLLWGLGTGERGEKYTIDPSLRIGFVAQAHPSANTTLSLTVRGILWGNLTEKTCEGDYGEIGGGLQIVNCRLAATPLPTQETLQYLADAEPNRLHVSLTYSASF